MQYGLPVNGGQIDLVILNGLKHDGGRAIRQQAPRSGDVCGSHGLAICKQAKGVDFGAKRPGHMCQHFGLRSESVTGDANERGVDSIEAGAGHGPNNESS